MFLIEQIFNSSKLKWAERFFSKFKMKQIGSFEQISSSPLVAIKRGSEESCVQVAIFSVVVWFSRKFGRFDSRWSQLWVPFFSPAFSFSSSCCILNQYEKSLIPRGKRKRLKKREVLGPIRRSGNIICAAELRLKPTLCYH